MYEYFGWEIHVVKQRSIPANHEEQTSQGSDFNAFLY